MPELQLSQQEYDQLKERLETLENSRLSVAQEIKEARAQGDLRENAAYHAAKEKQAFLESQIRELRYRLGRARVLKEAATGAVRHGSQIRLNEVESGEELAVLMVADLSLAPDDGLMAISSSSPLGGALMGRSEGDQVEVDTPRGTKRYQILEIQER